MPIASARRRVVTSTGGVLRQALQALQGARAAGFGGDDEAAGAVLVAQHHDSAAAKLRHGAFDGGDCSRAAGVGRIGIHDLSRYHATGFRRSEPLLCPDRTG